MAMEMSRALHTLPNFVAILCFLSSLQVLHSCSHLGASAHEALGWLLWNTKAFGTTGIFRLLDVALTLSVWRCLLGSFFFLNDHHTLSRRVVHWCWNPFPQMDQHVTRSSKHCTASVLDCTSPRGLRLPVSAVRLRRRLLQTAVVGVLV